MPRAKSDRRERLVEAAAQLAHQHGFGNTALSDIAREAAVPLGNVYYYFKTKAEIGEAIVAQRSAELRALREQWERLASPKDRLVAFIQMAVKNRMALARSGCPVGSLCSELQKEGGELARRSNQPFEELRGWVEAQFAALGRNAGEEKALAIHLLSALQGVSLLANSFQDPKLVMMESEFLKQWVRSL
jgi:TetR/AcrR family transcriptional regulator, transcriptional repressor for nem operon